MKKRKQIRKSFTIAMAAALIGLSPTPFIAVQAADSGDDNRSENSKDDAEKSSDDDKELEVKKGTEVYGEDISELTDEELQYVPKDWREGKVESEHRDENDDDKKARLKATHPNVNSYIASKNLPEAKVTINHKSVLPSFNYRYGKPEGVVAHETANDNSTINSEINYMTNNYNNAFVHAFVDDSSVQEVHPTDKGAWGAGRFANERFIHVELVRTKSFDKFARSVNNYANYIAELLGEYNLDVNAAKSNGTGTLWSHNNVSKYLGGTNHTDPVGYFSQWGYTWSQFVNLVEKKHKKLQQDQVDYKGINKLGKINSTKKKIHTNMTSSFDKTQAAGKKYGKQVLYVKQQAKKDGQTYYLISHKPSRKKGTIGWVKKGDIKVHNHKKLNKDHQTMVLKGSGAAFDKPWGGKDNKVINNLKSYDGQFIDIKSTEKVAKTKWYEGQLNGKTVWINDNHISGESLNHFVDVPANSKHHQNIYEMTDKGIIDGYPQDDGTYKFKPGDSVLRSHAALIFTDALDLPESNNEESALQEFSDIDASHLYAKEIAATHEADIFEGNDGEFMDSSLTREQMADILVSAFDLEDTGKNSGIKLNNISDPHQDSVEILAQHGVTAEKDDFRPFEKVTRQQFVTFVNRAMEEK